jgi:hypothetical protein
VLPRHTPRTSADLTERSHSCAASQSGKDRGVRCGTATPPLMLFAVGVTAVPFAFETASHAEHAIHRPSDVFAGVDVPASAFWSVLNSTGYAFSPLLFVVFSLRSHSGALSQRLTTYFSLVSGAGEFPPVSATTDSLRMLALVPGPGEHLWPEWRPFQFLRLTTVSFSHIGKVEDIGPSVALARAFGIPRAGR